MHLKIISEVTSKTCLIECIKNGLMSASLMICLMSEHTSEERVGALKTRPMTSKFSYVPSQSYVLHTVQRSFLVNNLHALCCRDFGASTQLLIDLKRDPSDTNQFLWGGATVLSYPERF